MTGDLVINVGTPNDAQITFDNGDTAGDIIIESFKLAEAEPMFRAVTDGRLYWGPGGAVAVDTSLYRDNVNSLRTSGSLTIDGKITYNAALNVKTVIKTATYTASLTDDNIILCDTVTPSASITINLPAGHVEGDTFTVKDWAGGAGAFSVVVDADGTETIDGATTYTLNTNYEWVTIVSDGTNWSVIG